MPPRIPMQGRMDPRMMPPGFGGRVPTMGMNQMPRNPMMGRPQQMNRGGGFLSRLFGRSGNPGGGLNPLMGMQQAGRAAGGGGLMQSLGNPGGLGGLSNILNNTQQVIKTAQSLGPMIQQYGPMVRNLPAIWRLYRGLKNAPDQSDQESENTAKAKKKKTSEASSESMESADQSSSSGSKRQRTSSKKNQHQETERKQTRVKYEKGSSIPKLYI